MTDRPIWLGLPEDNPDRYDGGVRVQAEIEENLREAIGGRLWLLTSTEIISGEGIAKSIPTCPSRFYEVPDRKEESMAQIIEDKDKMIELLKAENERLDRQREGLEAENRKMETALAECTAYGMKLEQENRELREAARAFKEADDAVHSREDDYDLVMLSRKYTQARKRLILALRGKEEK